MSPPGHPEGQGLPLFFRALVPHSPAAFQGQSTRHRRWGLTPSSAVCSGGSCALSLKARVRCAMALCSQS